MESQVLALFNRSKRQEKGSGSGKEFRVRNTNEEVNYSLSRLHVNSLTNELAAMGLVVTDW